jgi:hypothetical protein
MTAPPVLMAERAPGARNEARRGGIGDAHEGAAQTAKASRSRAIHCTPEEDRSHRISHRSAGFEGRLTASRAHPGGQPERVSPDLSDPLFDALPLAKVDVEGSNPFSRSKDKAIKAAG